MPARLEQFPAALAELQTIAGTSDSLLETIRQAIPAARYAGEGELQKAMQRVGRLISGEETLDGGFRPDATLVPADYQTAETSAAPRQLRDYRLQDKLGEGGMGAVYRAVHERLDKTVALKILPAERLRDPQVVARFHREMKAVGRLDHANIIRATDAGEADGTHYLVMEFAEGEDVSRLVEEHGPLRVADACEIIRQAAVGLQHAHEHNLVHRDIKPANMLLTRQGVVKLLDLGLARLHEEGPIAAGGELTSDGQLMGTVDYIAPEQAADTRTADIRADIYSLGCSLYKLLTGKPPFAGDNFQTPVQKIMGHTMTAPPSLAKLRSDLPPALLPMINRMLAKNRDDRFSTPGELAAAIEPLCEGADLPGLINGPGGEVPSPNSRQVSAASHRPSAIGKRSASTIQPQTSSQSPIRRAAMMAGLAASILAVAFGVFRIATDNGEIVITTSDNNVEVTVRHVGQVEGEDLQLTKGNDNKTTVRSGEVEVIIRGDNADGYTVSPKTVTLRRGDVEVVKIERKTGVAAAPAAGKPDRSTADRRAAEWVLSVGGNIRIADNGKEGNPTSVAELPDGSFELRIVDLVDSKRVNDAVLVRLKDCQNLTHLFLHGTQVSDAGLAPITNCKNLTVLTLYKTKVTSAGIDAVKQALPNCKIDSQGPSVDPTTHAAPLATAKADAEKPFVLNREGKSLRAFKSLGGALFDSKPGDVLEVHGNGPFELTGLEAIDKPLTLKAAAGYRPWFKVPRTIVVHNQPLDIEGCDFDCRDGQRLFEGSGATWEFRHCRFWNGSVGNLAGERIRFANCLAVGSVTFLYMSQVARVEFDNCLMDIANGAVEADRDETTISLKDNTFILAGFGSPWVIKVNDAIKERIHIEATGNLFISDNSNYTGPVAGTDCLKKVQWKGRENIYAGGISYIPNEIVKTLDDWNKLWGTEEAGSHVIAKLPLEWSRASGMDWTDARDYFAPRVAAARQKFKLAELGPDWDLVGPGEAYTKAREIAGGQPIPPDELRLEVPDGKPIVILRDGKVAASFALLNEANVAAQDNDIIELRMDGKVQGSSWEGKGRLLTFRAGLGYEPVVEHLQSVGDRLILEGLSFSSTVSATTWDTKERAFVGEGALMRVTNCEFSGLLLGRFVGADGQPGELSNCWIGYLHSKLEANVLRISNSHMRTIAVDVPAEEGPESRLELDRCTLVNPEPSLASYDSLGVNLAAAKAPLIVAMNRSYVVAPTHFAHVHSPERLRWEGAGNVYTVPRNYLYGIEGDSLAAWRARFNSDATSFEDLPTQFDPAQWRILTDSPGYVRREDGSDFGADVDRILMASSTKPAESQDAEPQ